MKIAASILVVILIFVALAHSPIAEAQFRDTTHDPGRWGP